MVSQAKGGCKECGSMTHTKMYHNRKPIRHSSLKMQNVYIATDSVTGEYTTSWTEPVTKKPIKRTAIKKTPVKKVKKNTKRITRSQLVKRLDTVFSQYIRLRGSIDGMATCVTCGDTREWQQQQNGHFYTRGRYPTRWDETNCNTQCVRCNVFLKGNYINYTMYMIDKYGRDYVDNLEIKSKSTEKITSVKLQEMIDYYKDIVSKY